MRRLVACALLVLAAIARADGQAICGAGCQPLADGAWVSAAFSGAPDGICAKNATYAADLALMQSAVSRTIGVYGAYLSDPTLSACLAYLSNALVKENRNGLCRTSDPASSYGYSFCPRSYVSLFSVGGNRTSAAIPVCIDGLSRLIEGRTLPPAMQTAMETVRWSMELVYNVTSDYVLRQLRDYEVPEPGCLNLTRAEVGWDFVPASGPPPPAGKDPLQFVQSPIGIAVAAAIVASATALGSVIACCLCRRRATPPSAPAAVRCRYPYPRPPLYSRIRV